MSILQAQSCINTKKFSFVNRASTNEYYMIGENLMNWFDAEHNCLKYGAHLPSISNQSDLNYLRGFFLF